MAKIVERLGWKYMSIVYEESNYGIKVNFQTCSRSLFFKAKWPLKARNQKQVPLLKELYYFLKSFHSLLALNLRARITFLKLCPGILSP